MPISVNFPTLGNQSAAACALCDVDDLIVASEALAAGLVTRQQLRTAYIKLHHNVYARKDLELRAVDRARAAWLWSRRKATLVGNSAAALLGSRWLPHDAPAELAHAHQPAPRGILVHRGTIADDEITLRQSIDCTTPARTAYDIGRRVPGDTGIIRIDALRDALDLADGGAESPKETELRLLLVRDGLPRPVTQIKVGKRRVDMGWPEYKVGVEYDGEHHFTNPDDYADDIERLEFLAAQRWIIVRVSARQLRYDRDGILRRVRKALVDRGY